MGIESSYYEIDGTQFAQLQSLLASGGAWYELTDDIRENSRYACADLGKMWHILHFILTGSVEASAPHPLAKAVLGEKLSYPSPGRFRILRPLTKLMGRREKFIEADGVACHSPQNVQSIAQQLQRFDIEHAIAHFDPQAGESAAIYPGHWNTDSPEEIAEFIREAYHGLTRLYQAAAARGHAVLIFIG